MARPGIMAARVLFAAVAVVAIVSMHGSGAEAHSCGAGESHQVDGYETDSHETDGHETDGHEHDHSGTDGAGGSASAHCGVMACTAIVASAPAPVPVQRSGGSTVLPTPHQVLTGTATAPDPPVPRLLLHV